MSEPLTASLSRMSSRAEAEALWRSLDGPGRGSFFTSWPWIGTWLGFLPAAMAPKLLRLERDGVCCGAAIAIEGMVRRHGIIAARVLHFNATGDREIDGLTIEHNGFAGCDPDDHAAWRALAGWFASGASDADELEIPGMTAEIAPQDAAARCLRVEEVSQAYRVDLARLRAGGGAIDSILSANARQQMRRALRALDALGPVVLDAAGSAAEALSFFDRLKDLHIRSWSRRGKRHAFTYAIFEPFHRALIDRYAADGAVELLRLSAGGRELGYLYNFRKDGHVYAYQSGFADDDPRLRPGYVAHALAIERHGAAGASIYDFMAGSNRLKQSFATDRYAMRWCTLQRPLLRFKAEHAARAVKTRVLEPLRARAKP